MTTAFEVLGGSVVLESNVKNEIDLERLIRKGLRVEAFTALAMRTTFSPSELDQIISRRTIGRRGRLSPEMSDRLIRYARIWALSEETFVNAAKAKAWLFRENRALGGSTPFAMLNTETGARLVENVLGRISYGVFS